MKSKPEKTYNRKQFILREGGLKFGGLLALVNLVVKLFEDSERLFVWPPLPVTYFLWLWMLVVTPVISFGFGCLFGFIMWELFLKRWQAKSNHS